MVAYASGQQAAVAEWTATRTEELPNEQHRYVLASLDRHRQRDLDGLFTLIRQPSISAQDVGVQECAELERRMLEEAGLSTSLLPTKRHPMVYGERCNQPGNRRCWSMVTTMYSRPNLWNSGSQSHLNRLFATV